MNPITAARHTLADALTAAGLPTTPYTPARPAPPCAQVTGTSLDQDDDAPYGFRTLRARVRLVVRPGTDDTVTTNLDDLTVTTIQAIDATTTWAVATVGEPYLLVLTDSQTFPAVDVTATTTIQL